MSELSPHMRTRNPSMATVKAVRFPVTTPKPQEPQMRNQALLDCADRMRKVAAYLESLADDPTEYDCSPSFDNLNIFLYGKDQYAALCRVLGGFEKDACSGIFFVRKKVADVNLDFCINREKVCKRIETTKIIPAKPEQVIPASAEREEKVVTWECPESLLKPEQPAEAVVESTVPQ